MLSSPYKLPVCTLRTLTLDAETSQIVPLALFLDALDRLQHLERLYPMAGDRQRYRPSLTRRLDCRSRWGNKLACPCANPDNRATEVTLQADDCYEIRIRDRKNSHPVLIYPRPLKHGSPPSNRRVST